MTIDWDFAVSVAAYGFGVFGMLFGLRAWLGEKRTFRKRVSLAQSNAGPTAREVTLAVCDALEYVLASVRCAENMTIDNDELAADLARMLTRHFEEAHRSASGGYVTLVRKGTSSDLEHEAVAG
jgi:hypothetical protein